MSQPLEQELDRLFAVRRDSFDEIEPSPSFDAALWRKIEARRATENLAIDGVEQELDALFSSARASFADEKVEASADYTVRLWSKIEAAQPLTTEQELDRAFVHARGAYEEVEASANFMPELWTKIEAARPLDGWLSWVPAWAPRLAGAGALAAALLVGAVWTQPSVDAVVLDAGYVDYLTVGSMDEHDAALWTSADLRR